MPPQFGGGVLAEVGGKLIDIFAGNLAAMLAAEPAAGPDDEAEEEHVAGDAAAPAPGTTDEALPLDVLSLTTRAWTSLRQDGIQTLGDLTRRTEQQLRALDNIGPASLADIKNKLADRGLTLADSGEQAATAVSGPASSAAGVVDAGAAVDAGAVDGATAQAAGADSGSDRPNVDHAVGRHAGPAEDLAEVTPIRAARHEAPPAWQPRDTEAIDLLGVAGLPVLKRALPAVAGLIAVILVVLGLRRRRSRSR